MSSGFVSENDLAEARKRRQEEWDKVRTADQPAEVPEEPYDGRSLYDRLNEQKMKKDMQYEEEHKLKNMIRGLNEDEADYLEMLEKNKNNSQKEQIMEEKRELEDFRKQVANLKEQDATNIKARLETSKKKDNIVNTNDQNSSQKALLKLGIKRKNEETSSPDKLGAKQQPQVKKPNLQQVNNSNSLDKGLLKCIAILPGLGVYADSSDSEASSDSEDDLADQLFRDKLDLLGRKAHKKKEAHLIN